MKFKLKKVVSEVLIGLLLVTILTGCGDPLADGYNEKAKVGDKVYSTEYAHDTIALKVGDYNITLAECMVELMQNFYMYGITPENLDTTGKAAQSYALSNIRQNTILSDVAKHNDTVATPGDIDLVNEYTDNFVSAFSDIMDIYGVTRDDVYEVFMKQVLVNIFENNIKNDMGKTINDDYNEQFKDTRFIELYQLTFPFVEVDGNNKPVENENGSYNTYTDAEKLEVRKTAEKALKELASGSDAKEIAKKYEVEPFSSTTNGYIGAYSDEFNELFEKMDNNDVSQIIEGDKGYIIYVMLNNDNNDLKDYYTYTLASMKLDDEFKNIEDKWLATIPVSDDDYVGTVWNDIDLGLLTRNLIDAGIVNNNTTVQNGPVTTQAVPDQETTTEQ